MHDEKIGIVSHDAGGAEILASYVASHPANWAFVISGPAIQVFERKLGTVRHCNIADVINDCTWMLCSTGWQTEWEWQAIKSARVARKRSVAFLDHWANYRERFIRKGEEQLPDEIWVGDTIAEIRARQCFPNLPITMVPNPYFEDLKCELAAMQPRPRLRAHGKRVLFICENIRESAMQLFQDERHWGYTEEDAIRHFLSNLNRLGEAVSRVVMRPHPSDVPNKYAWVKQEYGSLIVAGGKAPLLQEIVESDIVAGCGSTAMIVALLARKRVVCCIPPGGRPSQLPHPEIESWT